MSCCAKRGIGATACAKAGATADATAGATSGATAGAAKDAGDMTGADIIGAFSADGRTVVSAGRLATFHVSDSKLPLGNSEYER
ncbi:hypothetical protein ANCDUO_19412 [Ancylostoma duodenale]|uniref:Uncharacterized protein n=1 Tax=Ancylostoma duodenale TaxID=51022 RepID=A0A0C2FV03_9BILA|nr:hypothetical protein ANCDUO_19412 [Ancylostoma duodenale]